MDMFIRLLVGASAILSVAASAELKSFTEAYKRFESEWFPEPIEFECGSDIFKIEKSRFSGAHVYWKSGLEWKELDEPEFKEAGFEFSGLSFSNVRPVDEIRKRIDLPLPNPLKVEWEAEMAYFSVYPDKSTIPHTARVDVYKSSIGYTNDKKIEVQVAFNKDKYLEDHVSEKKGSALEQVWLSSARKYRKKASKANSVEERARFQEMQAAAESRVKDYRDIYKDQNKVIKKNNRAVEVSANKYEKLEVIEIPAGGYSKKYHCTVIE